MKELLKYAKVNVQIRDTDTDEALFEDHNLFVDSGRAFIANTLRGVISGSSIVPSFFACDLGGDATTPTVNDIDLLAYLPGASIGVYTAGGYPAALAGEPTGIFFQFQYTNNSGGDVTIRELGLFYRPDSLAFPARTTAPEIGTMLARLKTTLSSITVGDTRTITIDWKILF